MDSQAQAALKASQSATVGRREFAKLLGVGTATLDRHRAELPKPLEMSFKRVLWPREAVMAFIAGR